MPSAYIRRNIAVTTAGVFALDPLRCALYAMGPRPQLFSVDYPLEDSDDAARSIRRHH